MRSITFLLSEGLTPSNEGRGYVLRRIIRRASRHARRLGMHGVFLAPLVEAVVGAMGRTYPELPREAERARAVLKFEEERFSNTLEQGSKLLEEVLKNLRARGGKTIPGDEIFRLYDTYGFPLDLVRDIAAEEGLGIDEEGFSDQMQAQKERARASWVQETSAAGSIYRELAQETGSSVFTGYTELATDSVVKAIVRDGRVEKEINEGEEVEVILDKTPFYGESGGQSGDTGIMHAGGFLTLEVLDTKKPVEELITHLVRVKGGKLDVWTKVRAEVDGLRRKAAMRNHTATHLLQAALREILGEHVKQAGSLVDPERLRFDFTHFSAMEPVQIEEVEDFVNARILENIPVQTVEMRLEEAVAGGATALFGEKYGERVRVVSVGAVSRELCGGTHVRATGEIGSFVIASEGSVASGIRRIEALTGFNALNYMRGKRRELKEIASALKTDRPLERALELSEKLKTLEREMNRLKMSSARDLAGQLLEEVRVIEGVKVLSGKVDGLGAGELRDLADSVRDKIGSGVIVLAAADGSLLAMVTKDLSQRLPAGQILKEVAAAAGGRGGGKPELAQGGTRELEKLDTALQKVYDIVHRDINK
jgi:alanyl-tRNA synthetase